VEEKHYYDEEGLSPQLVRFAAAIGDLPVLLNGTKGPAGLQKCSQEAVEGKLISRPVAKMVQQIGVPGKTGFQL
jgi:hypothetical protein